MISFTGMGRLASVALIAGSVMLGAVSAKAQDVPPEHMQAAREAITALGVKTASMRSCPTSWTV